MTANKSSLDFVSLAALDLPSMLIYPAFIFGLFTFLITIFCNVLIIAVIAFSKDLQKPRFLLLVNLPIGDIIATIGFFPQFLISIVTQNRFIHYNACVTQAFFLHIYGCANFLTLSAMAYDRFIAICAPLRYNAIMTPQKVMKFIFWIWFFCFALIFSVFMLLVRVKICRNKIVDLYCNNPSIMKLICSNTTVNNYYGLFTLVVGLGGSNLVVIYTYAQILFTCIKTNQVDAWHKAIQTCGTHLVTFLLLQTFSMFSLVAHRFQNAPAYLRKILGVSILIFPPILDPIIYGLKVQELRLNIVRFLKKRLGSTK
ncbi:putative gustatory receptor clone PTE03 [Gouania willdenowi]|uniref:putative gustatory receptor clone PTE03 n=1 Tax=Gouania willdenowi TaxID=441366 RepID=UPI001056CF2F|nr:putative gustatory receptor clone PTE03 [Gouania willdenowi]